MSDQDTVAVRASSWADLFDCPHRWEGRHILGMWLPSSRAAHLGTSLHRSTGVFDNSRIHGTGLTVDDAAAVFVNNLHHPEAEVRELRNDLSVPEAERIGLTLHKGYCSDVSPLYSFRAVEPEAKPLDIETNAGVTVRLTGTLDRMRVRRQSDGIGITDLKTGRRAVASDGRAVTKGHHLQLGVYELLAEFSLGEQITDSAEIVGLQTSATPKIGIGRIADTRTPLVGTADSPGLIEMAAGMLKSGLFPPNPKSFLCSPDYCPRWTMCRFHD